MPLEALVHLVGFVAAVTLYALLLWMVLASRRAASRRASAVSIDRLPLVTAALGLAWNLVAFVVQGLRIVTGSPAPALMAGAYAALGFLPAVFVHAASREAQRTRRTLARSVTRVAYALSAVGGLLHLFELAGEGVAPSAAGLRFTAVGFAALVPAMILAAPAGAKLRPGLLWASALGLFGLSAWHLANHQPGMDSWSSAFFGHHASIPLALAILYQDYRFAFADIFLKRALTFLLLATAVFTAHASFVEPLLARRDAVGGADPGASAVVLTLWMATALLYPRLRRLVTWFVDSVVLGRADYAETRSLVMRSIAGLESADEILDTVCALLAPRLGGRVRWATLPAGADGRPSAASGSATMTVPTVDPPHYVVTVDDLGVGRRLLSDDVALLDALAAAAARRIDAAARPPGARERLVLSVSDSGAGASEAEIRDGRCAGLGLSNIERRLQAYYQDQASLELVSRPGSGTVATVCLPAPSHPGDASHDLAPAAVVRVLGRER